MAKTKKRYMVVFSDVHGNYEALKAVMRKVNTKEVEKMICLGDVIGYGPDPVRCWNTICGKCDIILKGNHEAIATGEIDSSSCSELGKISSIWTKDRIDHTILTHMKQLPNIYQVDRMLFCHSGCTKEGQWVYYNDVCKLVGEFADQEADIIFTSHTHRPRIVILDKNRNVVLDQYIKKDKTKYDIDLSDNKVIINTGSVGQQRDNMTDAAFVYCYMDGENLHLCYRRIGYNRFLTYIKTVYYGAGKKVANYLIRENWRRKIYESIADRSKWLFGRLCKG